MSNNFSVKGELGNISFKNTGEKIGDRNNKIREPNFGVVVKLRPKYHKEGKTVKGQFNRYWGMFVVKIQDIKALKDRIVLNDKENV